MQTTRALMLLLVTLCSLTANAQLAPGSTWRWAVASGGGQAERLFFVFEGNAPPPRRITERWTLEVGKRGDDGRTPATLKIRAKDGNSDFHFVTWLEGDELVFRDADRPAAAKPVVQRQAPPRVLSTERVPCTSALLGAGDGLCAGRAGGPLNAPPVPFSLVLSEDEHAASGLVGDRIFRHLPRKEAHDHRVVQVAGLGVRDEAGELVQVEMGGGRHTRPRRRSSLGSSARARPRWLMLFLSSIVSSAMVWPGRSSGQNSGS